MCLSGLKFVLVKHPGQKAQVHKQIINGCLHLAHLLFGGDAIASMTRDISVVIQATEVQTAFYGAKICSLLKVDLYSEEEFSQSSLPCP